MYSRFMKRRRKQKRSASCHRHLRGPERLENRLLLSVSHPTVVSENPADTTPHIVLDGGSQNVYAFEQIGRTMFAGGRFDELQDPTMTTTYSRQNFVAFDADTGFISPLNLSFNGLVTGIEASEDETALFISGAFSQVNGITRRGIMKYDLVNDQIDPTFAPTGMRTVSDIELVDGVLIAAGNFTKNLMAMDPTTGADLGTIDISFAGVVDPTDETRVKEIAVSPDGTRLVGTGNFATINGQPQKLAFMLNLGSPATLSTWYAPRFDVDCPAINRLSARGVDFSPDGSYFVIVSTGGKNNAGICDVAARFETADVSSTVEPTWLNFTGGDTLYTVAITDAAVYVAGHQRWLDNPFGSDSAGPGAVSRPGIGAIDPVTGLALDWNPTRSRNHGARALFVMGRQRWRTFRRRRPLRDRLRSTGSEPHARHDSAQHVYRLGPVGSCVRDVGHFQFLGQRVVDVQVSSRRRGVRSMRLLGELCGLDCRFVHFPGYRHRHFLQHGREPRRAELDRGRPRERVGWEPRV